MIRVLIADDHAVVRKGLRQILAETTDMVAQDEAVRGAEVLSKVQSAVFDVVLLDISMPDKNGLEVLKELKQLRAKLPVLILSMYSEDQYAIRMLKAGASGYLTKEGAPEELVDAIRKVFSGGKYVSPTVAEKLAAHIDPESEKQPHETLSDREHQVMCMIASGKTPMRIAGELGLSVKTISTYRTRILAKMALNSNAELTHYAIKNNLVE